MCSATDFSGKVWSTLNLELFGLAMQYITSCLRDEIEEETPFKAVSQNAPSPDCTLSIGLTLNCLEYQPVSKLAQLLLASLPSLVDKLFLLLFGSYVKVLDFFKSFLT